MCSNGATLDLELTIELPIGVSKSVVIPIMLADEYASHCSMKMHMDTLVVE